MLAHIITLRKHSEDTAKASKTSPSSAAYFVE
jgi:hypothetical protein